MLVTFVGKVAVSDPSRYDPECVTIVPLNIAVNLFRGSKTIIEHGFIL